MNVNMEDTARIAGACVIVLSVAAACLFGGDHAATVPQASAAPQAVEEAIGINPDALIYDFSADRPDEIFAVVRKVRAAGFPCKSVHAIWRGKVRGVVLSCDRRHQYTVVGDEVVKEI